jgi:hypothetical protein
MNKDPCTICLVRSCCSIPCADHILHMYNTKEYKLFGKFYEEHIEKMTKEEALKVLYEAEHTWFSIRE